VAGSGHGWTMGWAVAWNCIAKTYIIQNPPGALNWAIGCIGSRQQTARLFDSSPILAEGVFESYGKPVAPQSLYLAQLSDRLGGPALANAGYTSNTVQPFNNKSVKPLPPLPTETDKSTGPDLALHRPVNTSQVRGSTREFGGEKAVDGNDKTYWAINDDNTKATLEIDMEGPVDINAVSIGEAAGMEQRIQEYKVEGQADSDWKLLSQGTSVGAYKLDKFPATTVWKVRVTILKAQAYPAIRKVGLYLLPQRN
ncbi:MAG TPA: discoidin domain-containing protein, partial [Chitinophagaceae bacterium]|nr:discoidin domain-containing protein [Chitinophagaceae bacterium]